MSIPTTSISAAMPTEMENRLLLRVPSRDACWVSYS